MPPFLNFDIFWGCMACVCLRYRGKAFRAVTPVRIASLWCSTCRPGQQDKTKSSPEHKDNCISFFSPLHPWQAFHLCSLLRLNPRHLRIHTYLKHTEISGLCKNKHRKLTTKLTSIRRQSWHSTHIPSAALDSHGSLRAIIPAAQPENTAQHFNHHHVAGSPNN